jgi:hypothetical protein
MNNEIDIKNSQREARDKFNQLQDKYIYYIGALSVACIGFSVQQTLEVPIKLTQSPLALAIICWGTSVYYGLKFIENKLIILLKQHDYDLKLLDNKKTSIELTIEFKKASSKNFTDAIKYFKRVFKLFIWGCYLFIFWRILDMILINLTV